jgi:hypothetical protein
MSGYRRFFSFNARNVASRTIISYSAGPCPRRPRVYPGDGTQTFPTRLASGQAVVVRVQLRITVKCLGKAVSTRCPNVHGEILACGMM